VNAIKRASTLSRGGALERVFGSRNAACGQATQCISFASHDYDVNTHRSIDRKVDESPSLRRVGALHLFVCSSNTTGDMAVV
jgi:hypothetical protein